ncbi:acyl-CoA dehydrogenase family protein [Ktedonobacter racemifer]|uniref:Acyl-CoA dehydrogenase domain protein n=1 Tax=Ktedonobacter racemifer DSM 44963 TaxID=485913 RepID=D6TY43_KTERA|nr:acyl-CoA dehydrogenase family protein [Ktedonobacter racemifer]EFH85039.1 acyl-CoA dehydrogenase domain protein [Ktedonobacter racemifer DSM 44963]
MIEAETYNTLRQAVREVCQRFPVSYWRDLDQRRVYPEAFIQAMTEAGFLAPLIPQEYGGLGLGLAETSVILEEVNRSGGNAGTVHAQVYTMGTLLRHGSEEQKRRYLPEIARGTLRLQAFGVTEPEAGTDTTQISTIAVRDGDHYVISGQKIYISRVQHSDLMILLARTTPREQVRKKTEGLSVFLMDLKEALEGGLTVTPIRTMLNNETNKLEFNQVRVPVANRIGEEGRGFRYILDGMNAERILIASECVGDGRWFIEQATARAKERIVFGRPIGQNQGIQFPLAQAYAHVEAADLMRWRAATLFDQGKPCGAEANMAKLLAADASWEAANAALQTFGGYGLTSDYDIERKFRETRLYQVAPISTNLILAYLAEHTLGLPRSY